MRLCDQENINEFGTLNNKLLDIRAEMKQCLEDITKMEDASAELMMLADGKIMLFIGDSFVECSEEYANEYTEKKTEVNYIILELFKILSCIYYRNFKHVMNLLLVKNVKL